MIKFKSKTPTGKTLLGFGISAENVALLKSGKPIFADLDEMGIEASLMLFYKETTGDLIAAIQPGIGKRTIIHDHLDDK